MTCNLWTDDYNPFQKFKVLAWRDRMEKIPTGDFAAPVNIALDLCQGTGKRKLCAGLSCNFCMSDLEDHGKEARIPRDVLMSIPAFYREWGVLSVCLAGHHSDPLMYNHDDLIEFLRLLNKNDVEAGVVSNGVLLTDPLIQDITRNAKWSGFSVNAGTAGTHKTITGSETFERICQNIFDMNDYCKSYKVLHPTTIKFLITDDNFGEILPAIQLARELGCRMIQIRPCELPAARADKIDVKAVEDQIVEGIAKFDEPGVFGVFGVREKFTTDFKKKPPKRCIASPLGSTWMADGNVVICPDRRWSAHQPNMVLGNFITDGLKGIRDKWAGPEHRAMIKAANEKLGECIRCTAFSWHEIYEHTIENDSMDMRLV